jgi:hypothetical protein
MKVTKTNMKSKKSRIEISIDLDDGVPTIDGGLTLGDDSDQVQDILKDLHLIIRDTIEGWIQSNLGDNYIKAFGDSPEECKMGIKIQEDIAKADKI